MESAHLVGAGGAVGAVLRHYVGVWVRHDRIPAGTLAVNVGGSFLLGLVVFAGAPTDAALLVGTGVCGSFTTYSSFSVETVRLWEADDRLRAAGYAVGTLALCLVAAALAGRLVTLSWP
jgi:CrcB protein